MEEWSGKNRQDIKKNYNVRFELNSIKMCKM